MKENEEIFDMKDNLGWQNSGCKTLKVKSKMVGNVRSIFRLK